MKKKRGGSAMMGLAFNPLLVPLTCSTNDVTKKVGALSVHFASVFSSSAALVFLLAGCAPSEDLPTSQSPSSTLETSPPAESGIVQPSEVSDVPHDEDLPATTDALTGATTLSTSAMAAFCRPALDYETWIGELYPFLSQAAGAAYETVDPANVPCTSVTGDPVVRDGDDPYTVGVGVPTDAGEYTVYLHRTGADAPWAVEQITPVSAD